MTNYLKLSGAAVLSLLSAAFIFVNCAGGAKGNENVTDCTQLVSPDGKLEMSFHLTEDGTPR